MSIFATARCIPRHGRFSPCQRALSPRHPPDWDLEHPIPAHSETSFEHVLAERIQLALYLLGARWLRNLTGLFPAIGFVTLSVVLYGLFELREPQPASD